MWGRRWLWSRVAPPHELLSRRHGLFVLGDDGVYPTALPDVGPAYDLWLAFALCRTGFGAYYMRGRMTAWWVHPGQITGTETKPERGGVSPAGMMAEEPDILAGPPHCPTTAGRCGPCGLAYHNLRLVNRSATDSAARLAIRSRPANWRAWAVLSTQPSSLQCFKAGNRQAWL